jgi:hypothetical protein
MKKLLFPLCASIIAMVLGPSAASAATSASMAVSITVASSVTITIQSDASGLALGDSGTSAVTASLGTISAYGGVANQSSSNYTLTASCNSRIPPIRGRSVRPPSHPLPPLPLPPPALLRDHLLYLQSQHPLLRIRGHGQQHHQRCRRRQLISPRR